MHPFRVLGLGLRFLLELGALGALAYWGFTTGLTTSADLVLGLGAPLLAAVLWGLFVAPNARIRIARTPRLLVELVIFAAATIALAVTAPVWIAVLYAVLVVLQWTVLHGSPAGSGKAIE